MRGLEGATAYVIDRLEELVPGKLGELETRLGLRDGELGRPRLFTIENRIQVPVDQFPAIVGLPLLLNGIKRIDVDDGSQVFACRYRLRVILMVRGQDFADTTAKRDRYTLALTELILDRPSLGTPDARVEVETLEVRPQEAVREGNQRRSISGAWLEFAVTIEETVTRTRLGQVATGEIVAGKL